mmetsp:Transcript_763/g.1076  ORF Transcript_763/g.1076 Transcript_763/m.1076 type:complete len:127 (-) Transcript_763:76-456(-)
MVSVSRRLEPDIITYNTILLACSNTFGSRILKKEAYELAQDVFWMLVHNDNHVQLQPTSVTYCLFLKCIRKLVHDTTKKELTLHVFDLTCNAGMVNNKVLSQVQTFVPFQTVQDLPQQRSWTRHAM